LIRKTTDKRIRGRRLQEIREEHFRLYPLCIRCMEKDPPQISLAVELDHIVALHKGGLDFDQDNGTNRQGLCKLCHEIKTHEDTGSRRFFGFDAKGNPLT
jgi:5-methylcytosine-specific restriction endonuclease McrA